MPPKPKFTKEEVTAAAYALVREQGIGALTARELGARLGSSARPIFTVFADMAELKSAVCERARGCFASYMAVAEDFDPAYKMRGMQWVKFAQEQPKLFQLLFMQGADSAPDFDEAMRASAFDAERDIAIIQRDYHASAEQAGHLFRQMWIYTYGLCVLCAMGICSFTERELAQRLGEIFRGMIYVLTSDTVPFTGVQPAKHGSAESDFVRRNHPDLGGAQ